MDAQSLPAKPITIFIVEDDEMVKLQVRAALEQITGFSIIGEAEDGRRAVLAVTEQKPNVVLMDIGLPLMDGIDATRDIKKKLREVRVIMLTARRSEQEIFAAFAAGADGYCIKSPSMDRLVLAIRTVADGGGWLDPAIADCVLHTPQPAAALSAAKGPKEREPAIALSEREISVLRLVADGLSNPTIAEKLCLSVETVKTHVRRIMQKMLVDDRTQAAVKALKQGLI